MFMLIIRTESQRPEGCEAHCRGAMMAIPFEARLKMLLDHVQATGKSICAQIDKFTQANSSRVLMRCSLQLRLLSVKALRRQGRQQPSRTLPSAQRVCHPMLRVLMVSLVWRPAVLLHHHLLLERNLDNLLGLQLLLQRRVFRWLPSQRPQAGNYPLLYRDKLTRPKVCPSVLWRY